MELADRDLISIQEARNLINAAHAAQKQLAKLSQAEIDRICEAMARAGFDNAVRLAAMAHEETGFGRVDDKIMKNVFGSKTVYESVKDLKTPRWLMRKRVSGASTTR